MFFLLRLSLLFDLSLQSNSLQYDGQNPRRDNYAEWTGSQNPASILQDESCHPARLPQPVWLWTTEEPGEGEEGWLFGSGVESETCNWAEFF